LQIYNKYGGRCAYCGKPIQYKDMQADHIEPQRLYVDKKVADRIENLNPSCRRCNHYKRAEPLEIFRKMLKTLHQRTQKIYINKVAEDYGIIKVEPLYKERGEGRSHMRHTLGYVNHMLRMYANYCGKQGNFQRDVDRRNFHTVEKVLNDLPEWDRNVIIEAFKRKDPIKHIVVEVSKKFGVNPDVVWTVLSKVSRKIAKERDLI